MLIDEFGLPALVLTHAACWPPHVRVHGQLGPKSRSDARWVTQGPLRPLKQQRTQGGTARPEITVLHGIEDVKQTS